MSFTRPIDGVYHHEDLVVGSEATFGDYAVSREAIVAFATAYDPQPMHLDEAAAKASIVGGLCASGFHTCAMMMRLLCDHFLLHAASLGSPGVDEVKWLRPVRPGDRLAVRIRVLETRVLRTRPGVGLAKMTFELLDQTGAPVLSAISNQLTRLRSPAVMEPQGEVVPKSSAASATSLWDEKIAIDVPTHGNFFEDLILGEVVALGGHTFGRNDIVEFARQFDPQPFHLDEEAGRQSLFGGLAASGWHTAAILIRQVVLARQAHEAALVRAGETLAAWGPSPGCRDLKWLRPVLAGDHVEFRNKTVELRTLKSRPDYGLVVSQGEGRNQRNETVYRFTGQMFVQRRVPINGDLR